MDLFANTSLSHISIRSRFISRPNNKFISNNEQFFNVTNLLLIIFGINLSPNPCGKNLTNSQINPWTAKENKNSKVCNIKILLDSGASVPIVRKTIIHEYHKILKDKKNKWSTMTGTFHTEIILKLLGLNHTTKIHAKYHSTDKLLIYNLILGRGIPHKLGIIFNYRKKYYLARSFNLYQTTIVYSKRILWNQRKLLS